MTATVKYATVITTNSAFRGNWQVTLERPEKFGAFKYLLTPPPQEPIKEEANETENEQTSTITDDEHIEKENVQDTKTEFQWVVGERMFAPPKGMEVWIKITDREREYRACITKDGTVINNLGQILGFVNKDTKEAGSASERYLGSVLENKWDNLYQVRDYKENLVGYIDMGTASVKDALGATRVDLQSGGICKHPNGTYLGQFEGIRGYHNMEVLALYLMLLDPGMCSDVCG